MRTFSFLGTKRFWPFRASKGHRLLSIKMFGKIRKIAFSAFSSNIKVVSEVAKLKNHTKKIYQLSNICSELVRSFNSDLPLFPSAFFFSLLSFSPFPLFFLIVDFDDLFHVTKPEWGHLVGTRLLQNISMSRYTTINVLNSFKNIWKVSRNKKKIDFWRFYTCPGNR